MSDPRKLVGQVLHETYRLERLLGEGSMGAVYEASHLRLPRRFAIKLIAPRVADSAEAIARFEREARVTSSLGHPNIIEVLDFYHTAAGAPYIVMEFLEGRDLGRRLEEGPPMTLAEASVVMLQIGSGLEAAHGKGVVHRDLKPSNIFMCDGEGLAVKILDFGISKVLGSGSALTSTEAIIGTPHYMAPEQVEGEPSDIDPRTDIYAAGAIAFEMLAGRTPFLADSVLNVLYKVVHAERPHVGEFRRGLPAVLDEVVAKALAREKDARFPSATSFAEAFARACEGEGKARATVLPRAADSKLAARRSFTGPVAEERIATREDRLSSAARAPNPAAQTAVQPSRRRAPLPNGDRLDFEEFSDPGSSLGITGPHRAPASIPPPAPIPPGAPRAILASAPVATGGLGKYALAGAVLLVSLGVIAYVALSGDPAAEATLAPLDTVSSRGDAASRAAVIEGASPVARMSAPDLGSARLDRSPGSARRAAIAKVASNRRSRRRRMSKRRRARHVKRVVSPKRVLIRIVVQVDGEINTVVPVSIDGRPPRIYLSGVMLPVGRHMLRVSFPGVRAYRRVVVIGEAGKLVLRLRSR